MSQSSPGPLGAALNPQQILQRQTYYIDKNGKKRIRPVSMETGSPVATNTTATAVSSSSSSSSSSSGNITSASASVPITSLQPSKKARIEGGSGIRGGASLTVVYNLGDMVVSAPLAVDTKDRPLVVQVRSISNIASTSAVYQIHSQSLSRPTALAAAARTMGGGSNISKLSLISTSQAKGSEPLWSTGVSGDVTCVAAVTLTNTTNAN